MRYTERNINFSKIDKKIDTPTPGRKGVKPELCRHIRTVTGGAQGTSYTTGYNEHFVQGHTGTGQWTYDNGEWECRMNNGGTIGGYGGMQTVFNGHILQSSGGPNGTRSGGSASHSSKHGGGLGGGGQAAGGQPTGDVKSGNDQSRAIVSSHSLAIAAGETCGMVAKNFNLKATAGVAIASTNGPTAFTGDGNISAVSQSGCVEIGGKGAVVSTDGGPLTVTARGGDLSMGAPSGIIKVTSPKIYFNSSDAVADTPQQVVSATGKSYSSATS